MTLANLENVQQIYAGRTVLDLPAFSVQPGEILAIIGPSGAGKSTLLRLLALLEAPARGTVTVNLGSKAATYSNATIAQRQRLAMVFQRPILLSRSVRGNVAYGLRLRRIPLNGQIEKALERVALGHLADARPRTLSGGEMQRVALARALVLRPELLLLDEPTANLDPYNIRVIENYLREAHAEYKPTMVIVTHNIFQARRLATRLALILDGKLVETGPPSQIFESPQDPRTAAFISGDLIY